MATIEDAIYARSQAVSAVTDLVGDRLYPLQQPQDGAYPSVTYQLIAGRQQAAMGVDATVAHELFQFNAWATTYDGARAVIEALRTAFKRFRGTVATIEVLDVFLQGKQQLYEEEIRLHHHTLDLEFHYRVTS